VPPKKIKKERKTVYFNLIQTLPRNQEKKGCFPTHSIKPVKVDLKLINNSITKGNHA
jgi:hypothetical protein